MADLTTIFGPITEKRDALSSIDIVAFDIFGTLIDHNKMGKERALQFAHYLAQRRSVELAFISSEPHKASHALINNGHGLFVIENDVQLKKDFYARCREEGKTVLAIDDDAHAATQALIHIDPNNDVVRKYLEEKAYRHPALWRR